MKREISKEVSLFYVYRLHCKQNPRCTQIVPPQLLQCHRSFSFFANCSKPMILILSRFSSMLILYFVRYRLSSCFSFVQGYFGQSKQNFESNLFTISQFRIIQVIQLLDLFSFDARQPLHGFLSRRYAKHIPQFIPQAAIKFLSDNVVSFPIVKQSYIV